MSPLLAMNGNGKLLFEDPGQLFTAPEVFAIASARAASIVQKFFSAADSALWDFGTADFTWNIWFRRTGGQFVWSHGGDSGDTGATAGWMWAMNNASMLMRFWGSELILYDRAGMSNGMDDGNWHMLTMRRTGTTFQAFVDNVAPTTSYTSSTSIDEGTEPMYICRQFDNLTTTGDYAAASMWTRALSDAELTTLYNSGCGISPRQYSGAFLTDLQNAWPFDEVTGTDDAEDVTGTQDLTANGSGGLPGTTGPCS